MILTLFYSTSLYVELYVLLSHGSFGSIGLLAFYCNHHQVIFTNESNIERWTNKRQVAVDSKIGRLNNFIKQVKVPIQVVTS